MGYKKLATDFLQNIVRGKIDEAYNQYVSKQMIHHSPFFSGDVESLKRGMEENQEEFPEKIFEIKHVVSEKDMVIVHSHLRLDNTDRGMNVVHILRFQNNKIVEMWDISQPIPEKSPNENGIF